MKTTILFLLSLFLTSSYAMNFNRHEIDSILHLKQNLTKQFLTNPSNSNKRIELEKFSEETYNSILPELEKYICKEKDSLLLHIFMTTILFDSISADEEPATCLGQIFTCQPKLVHSVFFTFNTNDQISLFKSFKSIHDIRTAHRKDAY